MKRIYPSLEDEIEEKKQNREELSNEIEFIENRRDEDLKKIRYDKNEVEFTIKNLIDKYKNYQNDYELGKMLEEIPKESEYRANLSLSEIV